ncbi:BTAD domain-containing putative transcriptional regulator [Amycolatopsis sp. H20-H5]|uniref:BTAD domain-containing putative transcriptional regulator n=1 Tax=Amycolatopsis sp. H20-H5 TaxID=3046309 RepID=UPI002DB813DE|nr:BTAD domain-containing putative transcriptional regulator [Amycolatopsis sp. H20-H5]MEC3978880.1 BTAD domain-containing putative transcriptional regulator [Amycolatopsis sp. H20-H5]
MPGQHTPPTPSPRRLASVLRQVVRGLRITCRVLGLLIRTAIIVAIAAGLSVGLPWALVRFIGWPLPDHVPTRADWDMVPLLITGTPFVLDVLACLLWVLWAILMVSVVACFVDVARGLRWDEIQAHAGPLRRLVAGLLAAVLLSWLGRGAASATPATSAGGGVTVEGRSAVVATAPAQPGPTRSWTGASGYGYSPGASAQFDGQEGALPGTDRVRPPVNGVHDSLWRVALRCLGDGDRWPEIWALNHGTAQPHGRILINPNLIHPGDLLRLPTRAPTAGTREPTPHPTPTPAPTPSPRTSGTPGPAAPSVTRPPVPDAPGVAEASDHQGRPGGVSWGPEVFVSLGLAAAISAALALARLRHQARYRPGSGTRGDDVHVAPVVYELNLAHIQARNYDEDQEIFAEAARDAAKAGEPIMPSTGTDTPVARHASVQVLPPRQRQLIHTGTTTRWPALTPDIALATPTTVGGAEGRALALDLARAHGLGFVGPGARAATRALLLTVLTTRTTPDTTAVVVPADDLTALLGVSMRAADLPRAIEVVADLDAALASLEPALLPSADQTTPGRRPRVLVVSPPADQRQRTRLQGLLDNGAHAGIAALLLGQWQPGITAYVNQAGTISATSPGLGAALRGSRAFTLPDTAARDLLTFLRTTRSASSTGEQSTGDGETPAPDVTVAPQHATDSGRPQTAVNASLEITALPDAGTAEGGRVVLLHTRGEKGEASGPGEGRVAPLVLSVFGTPSLAWRPDPAQPEQLRAMSGGFSRRLIELLVLLGVHPAGMSRDAVIDALWGQKLPRDPGSVLRTVVSRIRRAVERGTRGAVTELVLVDRGQYTLAPGAVEVDFWAFSAAVTRRRAATTDTARLEAYEAIVDAYGGALADGLDTDWLTAAREAIRRDALEAVAALARAHVHDDPTATLDLLETARAFDPHNELLYRDIMRLEHTLGRHPSISRTLTLLTTRLAEIDATPTPATIELAARLRDLDTGITTTPDDRSGE